MAKEIGKTKQTFKTVRKMCNLWGEIENLRRDKPLNFGA